MVVNHRQFTTERIVAVPVCDPLHASTRPTALPAYYATEEPTNAEEPKQSSCCEGRLKPLIRFLPVIGKGHDSIWQYVRPDHEARSKGDNHQHSD